MVQQGSSGCETSIQPITTKKPQLEKKPLTYEIHQCSSTSNNYTPEYVFCIVAVRTNLINSTYLLYGKFAVDTCHSTLLAFQEHFGWQAWRPAVSLVEWHQHPSPVPRAQAVKVSCRRHLSHIRKVRKDPRLQPQEVQDSWRSHSRWEQYDSSHRQVRIVTLIICKNNCRTSIVIWIRLLIISFQWATKWLPAWNFPSPTPCERPVLPLPVHQDPSHSVVGTQLQLFNLVCCPQWRWQLFCRSTRYGHQPNVELFLLLQT